MLVGMGGEGRFDALGRGHGHRSCGIVYANGWDRISSDVHLTVDIRAYPKKPGCENLQVGFPMLFHYNGAFVIDSLLYYLMIALFFR